MSTMADFNVKMMLRDAQSQKVSFEGERQSKDALPPIRGFYQCDYDETELHIHIEEGIDLDLRSLPSLTFLQIRNSHVGCST